MVCNTLTGSQDDCCIPPVSVNCVACALGIFIDTSVSKQEGLYYDCKKKNVLRQESCCEGKWPPVLLGNRTKVLLTQALRTTEKG